MSRTSPPVDPRAGRSGRLTGAGRRKAAAGLVSAVGLLSLGLAGTAQAANPPVGLGSARPFSVLAGSTVTNTGPTTLFGDLGLAPGSSVTGAPHALGSVHINDGVATQAKSDLVSGYNDAAGRAGTKLASADLAGKSFTPGVYTAASSLNFSAGQVTLNAQGDPNAVFIFQVGSSITTGSATRVLLTNGAQPCNVFWKVGASATLGTNSRFIGTVMALTTITANTGATMDGRLLARNGAVNLDTNTITTSSCATGSSGGGGGGGTTTTGSGTPTSGGGTTTGTTTTGGSASPIGSKNTTGSGSRARARAIRAAKRHRAAIRAAKRRAHRRAMHHRTHRTHRSHVTHHSGHRTPGSPARPPHTRGGFTG
jgi:Ice-binding-like